MRILICEDERTSQVLLERALRELGRCDVVSNGKEGVEAFKRAWEAGEAYDLILMDIYMPVMNGHDCLREIRKFEQANGLIGFGGVKVIMTTALDDTENIVKAFYRDGAVSYLTKPISREALLREIKKLDINPD